MVWWLWTLFNPLFSISFVDLEKVNVYVENNYESVGSFSRKFSEQNTKILRQTVLVKF